MKKDRKIRRELLDELLAGYSKPEDLTGPEGLLKQLQELCGAGAASGADRPGSGAPNQQKRSEVERLGSLPPGRAPILRAWIARWMR